MLDVLAPDRVLIAGWATDFCADATVRSAVADSDHVVVVGDGHTLSDRPHLDVASAIRHHSWIWHNLITRRSIGIETATDLLDP
jgi:nicotinamidase-related amidase